MLHYLKERQGAATSVAVVVMFSSGESGTSGRVIKQSCSVDLTTFTSFNSNPSVNMPTLYIEQLKVLSPPRDASAPDLNRISMFLNGNIGRLDIPKFRHKTIEDQFIMHLFVT